MPVAYSFRSDWGNAIQLAFMGAVVDWEPRVLAGTADGFFKIAVRRHPDIAVACWSWALEWNENLRVVGFVGAPDAADNIVAAFPSVEHQSLRNSTNEVLRYRLETPLAEAEDRLFFFDAGSDRDKDSGEP